MDEIQDDNLYAEEIKMKEDLTDGELIQQALNMWANYIETGDINLSAKDAEAAKKPFKALDLEGMKMIIRLKELGATMASS